MKSKRSWTRNKHFFVKSMLLEKENVGSIRVITRFNRVVAAWYETPNGGHYHLPVNEDFMSKFNDCEHWTDAVQLLRSEGFA